MQYHTLTSCCICFQPFRSLNESSNFYGRLRKELVIKQQQGNPLPGQWLMKTGTSQPYATDCIPVGMQVRRKIWMQCSFRREQKKEPYPRPQEVSSPKPARSQLWIPQHSLNGGKRLSPEFLLNSSSHYVSQTGFVMSFTSNKQLMLKIKKHFSFIKCFQLCDINVYSAHCNEFIPRTRQWPARNDVI